MRKRFSAVKKNVIFIICVLLIIVIVQGITFSLTLHKKSMIQEVYQMRIESLIPLIDNQKLEKCEYLNLSIDDVIDSLADINEHANYYKSIFENRFFGYLKELHSIYGVKVVLYCFYENNERNFSLNQMTDIYKDEFEQNSEWLKLGFHTINGQTDYANVSSEQLKQDYIKVANEIVRFAGIESLSSVIRLQGFQGTIDGISQLQNTDEEIAVQCLLTADDSRISYNLSESILSKLNQNMMVEVENLKYIKTDIRLENIPV